MMTLFFFLDDYELKEITEAVFSLVHYCGVQLEISRLWEFHYLSSDLGTFVNALP